MDDHNERLRDDSLTAASFDPRVREDPPSRARAVVIGGGIIGASVALHLGRLGWQDVVVVERGKVAGGTTWHAAGLMTRTRGTHVQTLLASHSRDFYRDLTALSGVDVGYCESGSVSLAQTEGRVTELGYTLEMARHHDLPAEWLSPSELGGLSPLISPAGVIRAVYFEGDANVNPGVAAFATAKAASDLGARIVEDCSVTGIRVAGGRVTGLKTTKGDIECEVVVIAAGLWSRELGLLAGARLALHPAEHMWVQTEAIAGAARDLPIVRDLDGRYYARHYRGGLVIGAFEPDAKPRTPSSIPADFVFGEFEPDWEHFEAPLAKARERIPALWDASFAHFLNAPESFTPDANFLLGETAEVAGLFVAAGLNSQGIIFGPGIGMALAEWITEGAPTIDAAEVDVRRFAPAQANAGYLFERTREGLGRLYAMHWPFLQPETARGLRKVPLYDRLREAGACFGEAAGWERANWFAPAGAEPAYQYSYGRQNWFVAVGEEHRAARENVALFDLSSFAKIRLDGPAALNTAQRLFTSDLDRAPGSVAYTCLLNDQGGIEGDVTVTRLEEQSFLVVTAAAAQSKTFHWLRRHADPGTTVSDVTSGLGVLAVMGPRSRESLARLTDADLSNASFPFGTAQRIDIGWASVLALRVSFVGELGWELYAPVESLSVLFEQLRSAGAELGLRLAGYHALDSLRAEKGFLHWGADIGLVDTPYDVGLGWTVALDKAGGFVGQEALSSRAVEAATSPPAARATRRAGAAPVPRRDAAPEGTARRARDLRRVRLHRRRRSRARNRRGHAGERERHRRGRRHRGGRRGSAGPRDAEPHRLLRP